MDIRAFDQHGLLMADADNQTAGCLMARIMLIYKVIRCDDSKLDLYGVVKFK